MKTMTLMHMQKNSILARAVRSSGARKARTAVAAACLAATIGSVGVVDQARAAAAAAAPELSEIVVTARKREEAVDTIPITIDVLKGDVLKDFGVTKVQDLQYLVPGLVNSTYEGYGRIAIRGVGSEQLGFSRPQSTAVHEDGVYQLWPASALSRMFDVQRVEVLRGPQGTVYGRNASGGVVNVISNQPVSELGAEASIRAGSYSGFGGDAMLNVPVGSVSALRLAASTYDDDGRILNEFDGRHVGAQKYSAARATFKTQVAGVEATAGIQYVDDRDATGLTVIPWVLASGVPQLGWNQTYYNDPTVNVLEKRNLLARIELKKVVTDGFTLKSISGYSAFNGDSVIDCNPQLLSATVRCVQPLAQHAHTFTQEIQGLFERGPVQGVVGLYFLDADGFEYRGLDFRPAQLNLFNSRLYSPTRSYSLFADANWQLTPQLRLNVGARYNDEKLRSRLTSSGSLDSKPYDVGGSESAPTGRIGLDYTMRPGTMVYGSVSRGFQAGFWITSPPDAAGKFGPQEVKPELVDALAVGIKTRLGASATLNVEAFYYNYRDLQVNYGAFNLKPDGSVDTSRPPFNTTSNAAKARNYGLDVALNNVRVAEHLRFDLVGEYLNAKFTDYLTLVGSTKTDFSGNTLPRAPELSGTVAATIDKLPVGSWGKSSLRVEYYYRDKIFFTRENSATLTQSSIGLLSASASFEADSGHWTATISGRNLTDEKYVDYAAGNPFVTPGQFRTWEISAAYRF